MRTTRISTRISTVAAALLLTLSLGACGNGTATGTDSGPKVVPGAGPAGALAHQAPRPTSTHTRTCALSPDAIERWTRDGQRPRCLRSANRSNRNFGDDHRSAVG